MRLSEFLLAEMETVLAEWEAFAATMLPAAASMTSLALRNHASEILKAVAADLQLPQSEQSQIDKSKGIAPTAKDAPETAAQTHALLREKSGFDINQLIAEYRALRASVLRLYLRSHPISESTLDDVIRFNEAIDQAVFESVTFFSAQVELKRNLMLGMLGHDMRNPLNVITMTASYLAAINAGETVSKAASRLISSGESIKHLLDDLIDYNRTQLGLGINVHPTDADLSELVADEVQQFSVVHPGRRIEIAVTGDVAGLWDRARLQQLIRNLLSNALTHGAKNSPILIAVKGRDDDVLCEVKNTGPAIEPTVVTRMFEPLQRGPNHNRQDSERTADGLGLGLYIAKQIVSAHGGEIAVHSDEGETVFAVRLPRATSHPPQ